MSAGNSSPARSEAARSRSSPGAAVLRTTGWRDTPPPTTTRWTSYVMTNASPRRAGARRRRRVRWRPGRPCRGIAGRPWPKPRWRGGRRRARGERLEATGLAADAAGAVEFDDGVTDLAGQPAGASMQPTVEDDAGGDAGPDGEVGEILCVADDAPLMEADGRGAHVVLDDDRAAELELERVAEGEVGPAEVDRERHAATPRVDPGRGHPRRLRPGPGGRGRHRRGPHRGSRDGRNGAALVTHGGGAGWRDRGRRRRRRR